MGNEKHRSEIDVVINDTAAQSSVDNLLRKIDRAVELAGNLVLGGASGAGGAASTAAPRDARGRFLPRGGGAGSEGSNTTSTASGGGGGGGRRGGGLVTTPQSIVAGIGGALGGPGALFTAAGHGLTGIGSALPAGTGAPVAAAGAMAGLTGSAVNYRMSVMQQLAGLERPENLFAHLTGRSVNRNIGARFGIKPSEGAGILSGFARTAGGAPRGVEKLLFGAALSGVSPGAIGRLAGTAQAGMGSRADLVDTVGQTKMLINLAGNLGLHGEKIDDYLSRIASSTSQLAEQGLSMDLGSVTNLAAAFGGAGMSGMNAMRATLAFPKMGQGARSKLVGGFGGLGEGLLMAEAFSGGRDFMGGLSELERLTGDPEAAQAALVARGGAAAPYALLPHMSTGMAQIAGGGVSGGESLLKDRGELSARPGKLSRALAQQDAALLGKVSKMDNAALISIDTQLKIINLTISKSADYMIKWIYEALKRGKAAAPGLQTAVQQAASSNLAGVAQGAASFAGNNPGAVAKGALTAPLTGPVGVVPVAKGMLGVGGKHPGSVGKGLLGVPAVKGLGNVAKRVAASRKLQGTPNAIKPGRK
jgi:hypothetical protein